MSAPVVPAITSGLTDFLQPRWHRIIVEVGSEIEELWKPIANLDPDMSWNPMQEANVSGLGMLRSKPEGTGFAMDSLIQGGSVTYTAYPFGLGFEWTIEMQKFDLYGLFDNIAADLVRSAPHRVELSFWGILNDAFAGATYTGFDALPLASTAHPYLDTALGTVSNRSSSDVSLSEAGIQEVLLHYNTLKDMRGLPNRRRPALAIIHPSRIPSARRVFGSEFKPNSANNDLNTITDDDIKYYAVRYLTSTSAWHCIARPGAGSSGHDVWMRWAIEASPDQFEDRRTRSSVQTIYELFAVGFGSWFGWWSSAGTGA